MLNEYYQTKRINVFSFHIFDVSNSSLYVVKKNI